jgi:gamma-glutamylcysteine synthetase
MTLPTPEEIAANIMPVGIPKEQERYLIRLLDMVAYDAYKAVAKELREAERDLHELVFKDTFPDGTKMTNKERTILKDAVTIAIERIEKVAKQLDGEKVEK